MLATPLAPSYLPNTLLHHREFHMVSKQGMILHAFYRIAVLWKATGKRKADVVMVAHNTQAPESRQSVRVSQFNGVLSDASTPGAQKYRDFFSFSFSLLRPGTTAAKILPDRVSRKSFNAAGWNGLRSRWQSSAATLSTALGPA